MKLKEMIVETGINEILDVYYEHFEESYTDRFLNNFIGLLECAYEDSEYEEGEFKLAFFINKMLGSKDYGLHALYYKDDYTDRYAIYSIDHKKLLNMEVEKPTFIDDVDALCVIVDGALNA